MRLLAAWEIAMRPAGVGKEMQKGLEDQEASLQRLLRSLNSAPVTTASSQQTLAKKDHILQDSLSVAQVVVDVLVRAELVETLGRQEKSMGHDPEDARQSTAGGPRYSVASILRCSVCESHPGSTT